MRGYFIPGYLPRGRSLYVKWRSERRLNFHPNAVMKRIRQDGAHITPYDTLERRVVGRKIVNIEYNKIDWAKNFAANRKAVT